MAKPSITLATGMHERGRPLAEARVQANGFDLKTIMLKNNGPRHDRFLQGEFDAAEFSFALYCKFWSEGAPFQAIPVFLNRQFRHGAIFVNASAGIRAPKELEGKRMGVVSWFNTAALWARGALQHHYGVDPAKINWVTGEPGECSKLELPGGIKVCDARGPLVELLLAGEIDALVTPRTISRDYAPKVVRLFPNFREVEREYYKQTRVFPMSHALVIRKELLDRYETLADSIFQACQQAKSISAEYADDPEHSTLAWFGAQWEDEMAIFAGDPWPYGIEPNRPTLEALVDYAHSSGLLTHKPQIEEFFHPSSRGLVPTAMASKAK
jgi:4,5-dihydroxyphthalate decarboxylase